MDRCVGIGTLAIAAVLIVAWVIMPAAHAASIEDARELFAAGKYTQAAEQLREVIAADGDALAAHFWLGRCLYEMEDLDGAARELETVLAAKSSSVESRYWLAHVRRDAGRLSEARSLLRQVLEAKPDYRQAELSLKSVEAEIEQRQSRLGRGIAPDRVLPGAEGQVALDVEGLPVEPGEVDIYSDHVYDYTFSDPPTDWTITGGLWEATSRWTCSPQWSWFGGVAEDGIAAVWNKRQFAGDLTVEVYCAFKMGVGEGTRNYRNPNDMNVTICGDGANPSSGYSFIHGGQLNSTSRIMRGTRVLAENRQPEALLPIFEDGYPSTYEFHRKWWMVRVRKIGDRLEFWVDDTLVAEATDPEPLEGGRIAIWTRDNGLVVSRIKVYYERERLPRDPVPLQHLAVRTVEQAHQRQVRLASSTHPGLYNDFETELGDVAGRDGGQGAMVTLAAPGAHGSGHCAKLINRYAGGTFAADLFPDRFDLRELPRLRFDCRLDPESRVNLYLTVGGELCEIVLSGHEQPAGGARLLGRIPDVAADGRWHRVDLDLLGLVERAFEGRDRLVASGLFIGNLSSDGYLDAGFGGNHAGTTVLVDNLGLYGGGGGEVQVAASAREVEADGWALSIDRDANAGPPAEVTSEDGTATLEPDADGWWYVHARPRLADGTWGHAQTLPISFDTSPPEVTRVEPADEVLTDRPVVIHLSDGDGVGVDPASIRLAVGDEELGVEHEALSWEPMTGELRVDVARLGGGADGSALDVRLLALADRNGAEIGEPVQWAFTTTTDADGTAPDPPVIAVGEVPMVHDDFETDMGEWSNWGAQGGAELSLDDTTAASGRRSLRLYNPVTGGSFGAYVRRTSFDAGRYRIVRFAYKVPARLRADIIVHCNGRKAVRFTDSDTSYPVVGEVPDVQADNRWHYAEFNLYEMLRRHDPHASGYEVKQMWLADSGWTSNAPGQVYHIDDLQLVPIVSAAEPLRLAWRVVDISGLAGVNWAISDSPATELPATMATSADHVEYADPGDVDGWLHVRAADSAGNWSETAHRRILIDSARPGAEQRAPAANARTATSTVELRLEDEGIAGVDPGSIVLHVGERDYTVSNSGLTYLSDRGMLVWNCEQTSPSPTVFEDGRQVSVELKKAADYAGNPVTSLPQWAWTMDYSRDTAPPQIARVDCSTHRSHLTHTFESGIEEWSGRGGNEGARVEHDTSTAASGDGSVKLTQQTDGGHMQALVTSRGFPADRFPVIAFDYRFDPGLKLDLMVQMNGRWWGLRMTDSAGEGTIGRVPGVRADGRWHHASINIAPMLKRRQRRGPINVDAVIVGDRNSRDNEAGMTAHFDNFVIGSVGTVKPVFRWQATDTTGIAGYSHALDREPDTMPPDEVMGESAAKSFEELETGLWFFHVRAVDGAGNWGVPEHYAIMHSAG